MNYPIQITDRQQEVVSKMNARQKQVLDSLLRQIFAEIVKKHKGITDEQ